MPNPPTYDDLKRSRYSGRFKLPKRFKIINLKSTRSPVPDRDVLGTEDYNSLATETQIELGIE